jgi:hypothetical protein
MEIKIRKIALAQRVLVVASTRVEGKWAAYIDAVLGVDHEEESDEVLKRGCKLPENIARLLFCEFKNLPYAL